MGQDGGDVHPMVPVPEAIRTVIRETGRILIPILLDPKGKPKNPSSLTVSSDAPWSEILNQTLDQDVIMSEPGYPPYNASVMDGYAIRTNEFIMDPSKLNSSSSASGGNDWTHQVMDKVYAGDQAPPKTSSSSSEQLLPSAYYITTGAVVPDSYNCVVPIEECHVSPDKRFLSITTASTIQNQQWIRPIGCDIAAGSVVLPRGHCMDPVALGLLQQSGAKSIHIKRPIVVGVLSTGNELLLLSSSSNNDENQQQQLPGKIPDVNRPILLSMLSSSSFGNCCETVDLGMERDDDVTAMARTMNAALETCDVIITTGGISMGETDIMEQVLVDHCHGTLHFGRMHMKPGKPTTFVTILKDGRTRLVFAMPGNPVSATVCTQLLVRPCVDLLFHGVEDTEPPTTAQDNDVETKLHQIVDNALVHPEIEAKLSHDVKLDPRPEYHRVTLDKLPDGSYEVSTTGVQRSSRLMSCRDAQGLLVLPSKSPTKPVALKGETYTVLMLGNDFRGIDQVRLKDSLHLHNKEGKQFKVAVVEVLPKELEHMSVLDATCEQVRSGLSGSKSGNASIVSKKTFTGPPDEVYSAAIDSNDADFIVVSCVSFEGSFPYHLDVSTALRARVQKAAEALALNARQGAASQASTAALFETVVGYAPEKQGAMLVCLPDRGLSGGLENVRGLLKHALNVARGKPHNRHHTHKHHDHAKAQ